MELPSLILLTSGIGTSVHAAGVPFLFPLLAQTSTIAGNWFLGAAAFIAAGGTIAMVIDRYRRKPPVDATFATKAELSDVRNGVERRNTTVADAIERLRLEVKRDISDMNKASEVRASKIHGRIDTLAQSFASHQGTVTAELDNLPCSRTGKCPS